jgi:hypothetical protein
VVQVTSQQSCSRHGHEVISADLIDRRYGRGGLDFLLQTTALARAIVTNPPFSRAEAFLRHAAELGINYVAFLHKADWLNAADRGVMVETVWCPARCYLLQWRLDFKNQGAPTMNCNRYVFERASMKARSWTSSIFGRSTDRAAAVARLLAGIKATSEILDEIIE